METSVFVVGGGALGFVLYEFLRVYKKRIGGKSVAEIFAADYYFIVLFGAIVVGVTSAVLSAGEPIEAIYLGFSLPTCASAILGKGLDRIPESASKPIDQPRPPLASAGGSNSEEENAGRELSRPASEELEEIQENSGGGFLKRFQEYLYIGY